MASQKEIGSSKGLRQQKSRVRFRAVNHHGVQPQMEAGKKAAPLGQQPDGLPAGSQQAAGGGRQEKELFLRGALDNRILPVKARDPLAGIGHFLAHPVKIGFQVPFHQGGFRAVVQFAAVPGKDGDPGKPLRGVDPADRPQARVQHHRFLVEGIIERKGILPDHQG